MSLSTPSDDFFKQVRKMISEFIWNNGKAKIAYTTLIKDIPEGGLKLVDIQVKDCAIKANWVKKALTAPSQHTWMKVANEMLPWSIPELFEANISVKDINRIVPQNWVIRSVLTAWAKANFQSPNTKLEILNQTLWFNTQIFDSMVYRTFPGPSQWQV